VRPLRNGGLFGWVGTFSHLEIGRFRAYATNRDKCVVLELKDEILLITPDSLIKFVESAQALTQKFCYNTRLSVTPLALLS